MRPRWWILAAVTAVLLSRLPFFFHHPDWTVLNPEHCFLLSNPEVHAQYQAQTPDEDVPYWVIDEAQIRGLQHMGAAVNSHVMHLAVDLLGTRSLLPIKVVGTLYTALFMALFAWALARICPLREDRAWVAIPLFVWTFPTVLILWVSLTPEGQYFETHVFYGLFLPLFLAVDRGRERGLVPIAAAAGVLGGLAMAYTFSNLFLVGVFCLYAWLRCPAGLVHRLASTATTGVAALASFVLFGHPQHVIQRLLLSNFFHPDTNPSVGRDVGLVEWLTSGQALGAALSHVEILFGLHDSGAFAFRTEPLGLVVAVALLLVALAAAAALIVSALRFLWPRSRADLSRAERFEAYNGLLLMAFVAAYLTFEPYTIPGDGEHKIGYLVPTFLCLPVGAAALFQRAFRSRRSPVRITSWVAAGLSAAILITGWANALTDNARPLRRPGLNACDTLCADGYFQVAPGAEPGAFGWLPWRLPASSEFDRIGGEARCRGAAPGNDDTCAFIGYEMATSLDEIADCAAEPPSTRLMCAQADGAMHHALEACEDPRHPPADLCAEYAGSLRAACISGAYQGSDRRWTYDSCRTNFAQLCADTFDDPALLSGCTEQVAALLEGMPLLPSTDEPPPAECAGWPLAWSGLCARTLDHAARSPGDLQAPSCEETYLSRYAGDLPAQGHLAYDQCLFLDVGKYPWCAIGVARLRGETNCRWSGEFDQDSRF